MPRREWKFRVSDIIDAINSIRDYTKGMKLDSFVSDRKTVDAVVRNLIVIGEAATNMPDEIRSKYPDIPWYEMSGMRNFVIHEYFKPVTRSFGIQFRRICLRWCQCLKSFSSGTE